MKISFTLEDAQELFPGKTVEQFPELETLIVRGVTFAESLKLIGEQKVMVGKGYLYNSMMKSVYLSTNAHPTIFP